MITTGLAVGSLPPKSFYKPVSEKIKKNGTTKEDVFSIPILAGITQDNKVLALMTFGIVLTIISMFFNRR